jgi:hypothetical protein
MQSPSDRWFGAGRSIASDSAKAGAEATAAAVDGRTSELVFVFASVAYDLPTLLGTVRKEVGDGPVIVGASTIGEISTAGPTEHGVAVSALGGGGFTVRTRVAHIGQDGHRAAGADVAQTLAGMDRPHSVLILLADGLSGSPHEIVRGAYSVAGAGVPLVGGFAGDDRQFRQTYQFHGVGWDVSVLSGAVVGIALGSDEPLGIGIAHGWHRVEPPMIATRSAGETLMEIDDRPALMCWRNGSGPRPPRTRSSAATSTRSGCPGEAERTSGCCSGPMMPNARSPVPRKCPRARCSG